MSNIDVTHSSFAAWINLRWDQMTFVQRGGVRAFFCFIALLLADSVNVVCGHFYSLWMDSRGGLGCFSTPEISTHFVFTSQYLDAVRQAPHELGAFSFMALVLICLWMFIFTNIGRGLPLLVPVLLIPWAPLIVDLADCLAFYGTSVSPHVSIWLFAAWLRLGIWVNWSIFIGVLWWIWFRRLYEPTPEVPCWLETPLSGRSESPA